MLRCAAAPSTTTVIFSTRNASSAHALRQAMGKALFEFDMWVECASPITGANCKT
jgi:hypothetical protein